MSSIKGPFAQLLRALFELRPELAVVVFYHFDLEPLRDYTWPDLRDPRRDFILSLAFAQQRGNAVMLRQASARRLRNRAGGRHATGARA